MGYRDGLVANATFRFVTETEVFILPRKYPPRFHPNDRYYSPGVVFHDDDGGGINNERHKEGYYENAEA